MFNVKVLPTQGDSLEALITQAMTLTGTVRAGRMAKEAFDRVVRRAMGRTGSDLFKGLKNAFKNNTLNLEKKQVYGPTSVIMTRIMSQVRPWELYEGFRPPRPRAQGRIGGKFFNLMQYKLTFEDNNKNLEVGLIPERRGGTEWAKKFSDWQDGGAVDVQRFQNYSPASMRRYFAALGMPIRAGEVMDRPKRPVIDRYKSKQDPAAMFQKNFLERLRR